jgi:site-specific recombinase XerD
MNAPGAAKRQRQAAAWAASRDTAIVELFYGSGLRLSELVALDVADIDPYTETVRVIGKGQKERIVPLPEPHSKQSRNIARKRMCIWSFVHQQTPKTNVIAFCLVAAQEVHSQDLDSVSDKSAQTSPFLCDPFA